MDTELKDVLTSLAEGQGRTDASLRELVGHVRQLAAAQKRTEERLESVADNLGTLTARVDRMAELMIRGFNKVHKKQTDADRLLDEFEDRLNKI